MHADNTKNACNEVVLAELVSKEILIYMYMQTMNNTLVKQNARLKHSSAMFGNKIMAYVVNVDVNTQFIQELNHE